MGSNDESETKRVIRRFREFLIEAYRGEAIPADIYTQGLEACDRLDRQAEDNKDLHKEYQDLATINLKLTKEIERLKERIEELENE